jgi:hypothetical protein
MNSTVKFLAILTAFAGSSAMAQINGAQSLRNELANHPAFEVRVYDYAHLDPKTLQAAENEADRIFSNAGVNVRWIACPTSHDAVNAFPACSAAPAVTSNTLIIQTGGQAGVQTVATAAGAKADHVLGDAGAPASHRAYVYFGRIENLTGGNTAPADVLLGRVIARLMGRELLGDNAYAKTGILQDSWGLEQLNQIAGSQALFTRAQAQQMVSRLNTQNATLAAAQNSANANGQ